MKYLGPTSHPRLNEALAVVFLFAGLFLFISLISYHPFDPSLNTASEPAQPANLTGLVGAYLADFFLQILGIGAYAIPALILILGWKWIRSAPIEAPLVRICGGALLMLSTCAALGMASNWRPIAGIIPAGGLAGSILADALIAAMNLTGAVLTAAACWIVSLYLISAFEMKHLLAWFRQPLQWLSALAARFAAWREERARRARLRAQARSLKRSLDAERAGRAAKEDQRQPPREPAILDPLSAAAEPVRTRRSAPPPPPPMEIDDIPIHVLEPPPFEPTPAPFAPAPAAAAASLSALGAASALGSAAASTAATAARRAREVPRREAPSKARSQFQIPPTDILQEPAGRSAYDSYELKEIAGQIKSKFEEFNVLGSVTQINPGPVVTTFEFKPEAGVKYSRITTLSEDLCLGLQAESILIERIPGKPTVGIEVPNSKREVISLRQILESEEFNNSPSPLTVALGKDISGRIKVAALDSMPHLLIAGSTGSGKSVMLNSLIMSILYKATPHQVRMIMVDPKRLEFGPYEGIPHLLTPVITDAKKATIALRNAVLEMERRLKLLASQGVRNIEQYNRKVRAAARPAAQPFRR